MKVNYLSQNLKKFNILTSNSFAGPMANFPKCVERLVQPFTTSYESYIQTPWYVRFVIKPEHLIKVT